MIDNAVWVSKIVMAFVAVWLIYVSANEGKEDRFAPGVMLLLFALFLTGAEMITDAEQPWTYLFLAGTEQDWSKAFFGGVMMLMLPAILLAVCGKDLAKIIDNKS